MNFLTKIEIEVIDDVFIDIWNGLRGLESMMKHKEPQLYQVYIPLEKEMVDQNKLYPTSYRTLTPKESTQHLTDKRKHSGKRQTCSICLTNIKTGEDTWHITCGHVYHLDCLESWFEYDSENISCPLCREQM
jgi:hypothetical protein